MKRTRRVRSRKLIAAGAAAALVVTGGAGLLQGQQPVDVTKRDPVRSLAVVRFEIPAGALGETIAAFEQASGWQVEILDARLLTLPSSGVKDVIPASEALKRLLEGTGAAFQVTGPAQARLTLKQVVSSIEVQDSPQMASPRYTEPLRDIPQTVSVIPKAIIEQQGATSLTEVLRNVPGITITAGEGGVPGGDNLTMRGNSARNDIFVDGVRDLNPQTRDPFNLEQVEVTKGPTSAVTGRGSAGGAINLTSKGPGLSRIIGGSLAVGNAGTKRATVDLNVPLARLGLGERTAFRMNAMVHDADVAGRNAVYSNRWGFAPSLAVGLGTPTRLTFGYYKLKQSNLSDYGIPWVPATNNALAQYRDQPAPVARETFYGYRDRDREILDQDTGTVRLEHDFSDNAQLRSQFRIGDSGRNSMATPPRFASNDSTVINREMRSWIAEDRIVDSQTDLRILGKTGGVQHSLVTGAAFTNERNLRQNRTGTNASTTLLNPNPDDHYEGTVVTSPIIGNMTGNTQSVWAFDTLKFGRHWEAVGGLRWERFAVDGVNATGVPVAQTVNYPSLRAALIYKPVESASIYASAGNSVSPSLEGLSYSTSNTNIPPEKTYTAEAGTKWEVAQRRLLLSGALFQVRKDNARTPGLLPTDPPQVLAGRQISQGLELSATGSITRSLRVLGSYTLIDARIRSSNTPAEVGRYFQNTPRNSASIWVTYSARRFTLGLGPRFMGRRFGNNTNTRRVDAYTTLDAMASYTVNRHLDLRFNVSNFNNAYYFERLGGGHLVPGPARFAMFTTNFRF